MAYLTDKLGFDHRVQSSYDFALSVLESWGWASPQGALPFECQSLVNEDPDKLLACITAGAEGIGETNHAFEDDREFLKEK